MLYEIEGPYTKIGTAINVKYRLSSLRNGNPRKLNLHKIWHVSSRADALKLEREVLIRAVSKRVDGRDWVLLSHELAVILVLAAARDLGIALKEVA